MHPALKSRVWPLVAALLSTGVTAPAYASEPKKPTPAPASSPAPAPAAQASPAPTVPEAKPEDVATPESIVAALYDVISGPKGQARNWDRFRSLFVPGARMIPSGKRKDGTIGFRQITTEEYISNSGKMLVEEGFREREIHRVEERFGSLIHVFSTYEAMREGEPKPFMRGVNSIQLINDGKRWWVLTVAWTAETPEQPLPAKYLPASKG
ncbi:nuclear transport factor 2 family protein [Archangium lansingense]|uniref:Nuclear transport factor 2 family protein n=1 Tax=Archangium lansingense TaxID=2995310 RepID=A0ABT4ABC9_9BACT|nr:nuclear transport factor 2 family protein [Archangium lansinium]MCY1078234.1 nuclear transport factor 2 family protein [Archangium lansinium]